MTWKERETTGTASGILVLGIGNLLMGDEGAGVHYALLMEAENLPENVDVMDGGTAGFQLLEALESHAHIIMVDATLDGGKPGTIREIRPRFSSDFPKSLSTHDIGLKDLIEALYLAGRVPGIHLFTVSIAAVQPMQIDLSPAVEAVLPELVNRTKTLIEAFQEVC